MGLERGVIFLRSNLELWREEYGDAVAERVRKEMIRMYREMKK